MAQILRQEFHTNLANQFVRDTQLLKTNLYYFLGQVSPWGSPDTPPADVLSLEQDLNVRDNMLYINKIMPNDITLCIPRYDWQTGVVYARWDDSVPMASSVYYVVTTDYRVYKCLDNNNGEPSTVMPTEADGLYVFRGADNYVWKYMYSIPTFKQFKFANGSFIPVQNAITDSFYNRGSVEDVIITQGGTGYSSTTATSISVGGPGASAVLIPVINDAGSIIRVKVVNGGTGYTTAPVLTVTGIGTNLYPENSGGAILEAVVSAGVIQSVLVRDPGISYVKNGTSTITIKGDGAGAVLHPVVYGGAVVDIVIENNGSGYSYMDLTVVGTGTGASLIANLGLNDSISDQSIVEQLAVPGAIYAVRVVDGGSGYDPLNVPKITVLGDGVEAAATAIMNNGSIVAVEMTSFGRNYSYVELQVEDPTLPGGVLAVLSAIKSPSNGHGYDSVNELNANVVCVSSVLSADSILSEINQDYRQYGILKNPRELFSNVFTNASKTLLAYKMKMLSTVDMEVDMVLKSANNYRYLVVKFDAENAYLQPLQSNNVPPLGALSSVSAAVFFATELITAPLVNKYSGDILTTASEVPFKFTSEQSLALKTYIKC
jgi:hypothetical protein